MEFRNTGFAWTVIINLDFITYEQTIVKLRDDLFYRQEFKTPVAPVNELNHIEYVLQKLEEEINVFREMLPRLDKRRAALSAVGSVLKCFFFWYGYIVRCREITQDSR